MEPRAPDPVRMQRAAIVHEIGQAVDLQEAETFEEALHILALQTRLTIGAHQSAISYLPPGDFDAATHTHSFSEKYEKYNTDDVMLTSGRFWGVVVQQKHAMRMTQEELVSHPMWKQFSDMKDKRGLEHPPMRGWLAAPMLRPTGEVLGVIQLSDKLDDAEFTSEDLDRLIQLTYTVLPTFELQHVSCQLHQANETIRQQAAELEKIRAVGARGLESLQFSEARYRRLFESAKDGIIILEAETGKILDANPYILDLLGYSLTQVLGMQISDISPFKDIESNQQVLAELREKEYVRYDDLPLETKEGKVANVEFVSNAYFEAKSKVIQCNIRDITLRRRTEKRLAARGQVTGILAESTTAQEVAGRVLPVVCQITGWCMGAFWAPDKADDVLRCVDVYHVPKANLGQFEAMTRQGAFAPGIGLPGRVWANGQPAWVADITLDSNFPGAQAASSVGLHGAFGFPVRLGSTVLGVMEFLSTEIREPDPDLLEMFAAIGGQMGQFIERKRAEEAEREAQKRYRSIFENAVEGIFQTTVDGKFLTVNPAMARMLGYDTPKELMATVQDIGCQLYADAAKRSEFVARLAENDVVSGFECQFLRKDRSAIWVSLAAGAIRDVSGVITHLEGTVENITPRKQVEEQLRQAQKMEAIGSLAGGVAHDFNNILTIINGYNEIIQTQLPANSPLRELVRNVGQAGERAASLTRQLLAFSRKQVLELKVLDINTVVTDLEKMLRRLIGEDIDIQTVLEPALGRVKADPGQIEQVLINFAVNARDAMPQGGKLTIETANVELDATYSDAHLDVRPGRYVLLDVSDTGCGMDEATKARIFEPFFTTKGPSSGTGLGLATVYSIVKQSEGHIAVYSEPGRGTTFKVYLPMVENVVSSGKPRPDLKPSVHGTETILLVEDEPALRALARHALELNGYTVLEAGHGKKALHIAEEFKRTIHLLVTDVVMPVMGGRQLAERLVMLRPDVKILYLSGYTDDAVIRNGVLQAEAAFLQKPFTPSALAQKVREVLDRREEVRHADR